MEEQLITFETAKLAREKGFNEWCNNYYNDIYTPPKLEFQEFGVKASDTHYYIYPVCTQSLLQRWLREKHNIDVLVGIGYGKSGEKVYCFDIIKGQKHLYAIGWMNGKLTYEQALEAALIEALKLIIV